MTHIRLYKPLFVTLVAHAALIGVATADSKSVCSSSGVNFMDGQTYSIESASTDPITVISQFSGCNADIAKVQITSPNGTIFPCSAVPLTPDNTDETSTCSINENQITPGDWIIVLTSNNGDGKPYAAERKITFVNGITSTSSAISGPSGYPNKTGTVTPTATAPASSSAIPVNFTKALGAVSVSSACAAMPTTTTVISTQTCTVEVQEWIEFIEVHEGATTNATRSHYRNQKRKDGKHKDKPSKATASTTVTASASGGPPASVTTTAGHCAQATITEYSVSTQYTTVTSTYTTSITSYASGHARHTKNHTQHSKSHAKHTHHRRA